MTWSKKLYHVFPSLGIIGFFIIYLIAAAMYPGGNQADLNKAGFDWIDNYWCDLINETGRNGMINPGRPLAIMGTVLLCISLAVFFIQFAQEFSKSKFWRRLIQISGILSMALACLIFTPLHNEIILISSIFGLLTIAGILREIFKQKLANQKFLATLGIILIAFNNFIYYSKWGIEHLPLIQKLTFLYVLLWILYMHWIVRNECNPKLKTT